MIRHAAFVLAIVLVCPAAALAQETTATTVEARQHTVIAGETLWEIARGYYGSPFEWRRIYDANQTVVANPHWIEPGEILDIPGATIQMTAATVNSEGILGRTTQRETSRPVRAVSSNERVPGRTVFYQATARDVSTQPAVEIASRTSGLNVATKLRAIPHDVFYAAGWLVKPETVPEEVIGRAVELADDREGRVARLSVLPFERVRVAIDGTLPEIGEQLLVVRTGRRIKDAGEVVIPTGVLTVASHEDPGVVAVLSNEYDRVMLGDFVMPLPAFRIEPGVVAKAVTSDLAGNITAFPVNKEVQSLGDVAFLSLGIGDGVLLGDEFLVYTADEMGWAGEAIGRVQIIGVRANQSSARIVDIEAPVFATGQRVRLVARMP